MLKKSIRYRAAITILVSFLFVAVVFLVINKVAVLSDASILTPSIIDSSSESVVYT